MNAKRIVSRMITRMIAISILLTIGLIVCSKYSFAHPNHVTGSKGLAPVLPTNVPGVERPFPQDEKKFTFAIIGDKTGGGERNWPIFDRAMDEISHLHPDFAIMVGDLIQGYTNDMEQAAKEWKEFSEHANRIQIPFFFLPGNHDISNKAMYEYWNANLGKTYYSFDYKGCHFILLNTEEGWKTNEEQFGSEQLEWIRQDIAAQRNSKHIFIFMHRPVWYHSGEELAQWEKIESWLKGLPYTVFAGHFHDLAYELRHDRRYFVLSATGAELTPSEVLEFGYFHHYTTVTVDGNEVHIAIIEPGSIHPYDIAQREFKEKASKIVAFEKRIPLMTGSEGGGEVIAHLNNSLDKPVAVNIKFSIADGDSQWLKGREKGYWHDPYMEDPAPKTSWKIHPREASYVLQPGESQDLVFKASYNLENMLPFPSYFYSISYGGTQMLQEFSELTPMELRSFTPIREWMVVGPFDLGIRQRIPVDINSSLSVPKFIEVFEPERNWKLDQAYQSGSKTVTWQKVDGRESGWVDLDSIYGSDYVFAYGLSYIYSPKDQKVLAAIWGDDITRVFVNGQEVVSFLGYTDWYHPHYFLLPLKPGWNPVLIKNGDTFKAWGFALRLANLNGELRFSIQPLPVADADK